MTGRRDRRYEKYDKLSLLLQNWTKLYDHVAFTGSENFGWSASDLKSQSLVLRGSNLHDYDKPHPTVPPFSPPPLKAGERIHWEDKIKPEYNPPKPPASSQLILRTDRTLKPGCFTDLFTKSRFFSVLMERHTARSFLVPALAQTKLANIKVSETIITVLASVSPVSTKHRTVGKPSLKVTWPNSCGSLCLCCECLVCSQASLCHCLEHCPLWV